MLVKYSGFLVYPGGFPASDLAVPVTAQGSNVLSLLFTDVTGTTPLANPVMTDDFGYVEFWSAPGVYETSIAADIQRIPLDESVTDPVWPDLWVHVQSTPAAVWTVDHHFGVEPSVDVLVSGAVTVAEVAHAGAGTTVITFAGPATGSAYLRR